MFDQQPRNIGSMAAITPSVKFLLILNVSIYLFETVLRIPLSDLFSLPAVWWESWSFGSLFTYMFVHANSTHLFVNMLGLFFIGPAVEQTIGSYRFFVLYYLSGVLGGLGWSLLAVPGSICVGASGAVMGILGAFGALYPNVKLLLWFILPIKAWVLVTLLLIWELYETVGVQKIGGIANAAHLMGAIAGICYAMTLKHPHIVNELKQKLPGLGKSASKPRPRRSTGGAGQLSKEEVDRILDKIGREGMGALSLREREMLKKATRG